MPKLIIESKTHGTHTVLFDEKDREKVESHTWTIVNPRDNTYYANTMIPHPDGGWSISSKGKRRRRRTGLSLHRLIMDPPKNMIVDHINHNGLDNRKENLRICTHKDNMRNRRKQKNNISGYKGVRYRKKHKKFVAQIKKYDKQVHIGCYETIEEAAMAYDANARHYYGEYACLNFPQKKQNSKYIVTMPDNQIRKNNTSGFRGVYFTKRANKWIAAIEKDKKKYHLGHYDTPEEAARAYDAKAKELFGEFARLNFPEEKV